MIEDIVVYGTGGTSRDIVEALEAINERGRRWNLLGFLDDDEALHGGEVMGYTVLGGGVLLAGEPSFRNCKIAIGVANDRDLLVRKTIRERLGLAGERFPVVIHPLATVSRHSRIAEGAAFLAGSHCSNFASIGKHVLVHQNCAIGHDAVVADFVTMAPAAATGGKVQLGEGAYLGLGATVLPGVKIGSQARVGMGSVVIRNVPDHETVFGNPARALHRGAAGASRADGGDR